MNAFCVSSRSKCSATDPARVFSSGITAQVPRATRSNTSAERAHGTIEQPGSIRNAAWWLNDPSSPWIATFIGGNYRHSAVREFCSAQVLLEYDRIHSVRVIPRNGFHQEVLMAFVERQGRLVVHRRLERDRMGTPSAQPFFGFLKQFRPNPEPPRLSNHINGDDVSDSAATRFSHQKSENGARIAFPIDGFGDQREGAA